MSITLPSPIETYFAIQQSLETDRLADILTADALVHDESHDHRGPVAIAAWMRESKRKYNQTTVPTAILERNGKQVVSATVSGNFPGSPLSLDFTFGLFGDRISDLEIH